MAYPDNNPKSGAAACKIPLHLVPPAAIHAIAEALADGARKYGPYNWRDQPVAASVYVGALRRHIDAWWDGEDCADDSALSHLSHLAACVAILNDAKACGVLIDDRPPPGPCASLQRAYHKRATHGASPAYLYPFPPYGLETAHPLAAEALKDADEAAFTGRAA